MSFIKLSHAALVIPSAPNWRPQRLGAGSILQLLRSTPDENGDLLVSWVDVAWRTTEGYIAAATAYTPAPKATAVPFSVFGTAAQLKAHDVARERRFTKKVDRATLRGLQDQGKNPSALTNLKTENLTMATATKDKATKATKATTPAKSDATPAKAKAKAVTAESPARSMGVTVGNAIVDAKPKDKTVLAAGKKLAGGESMSRKQLEGVRDAINAEASEARANDDAGRAAKLSSVNRLVRRLYRSL